MCSCDVTAAIYSVEDSTDQPLEEGEGEREQSGEGATEAAVAVSIAWSISPIPTCINRHYYIGFMRKRLNRVNLKVVTLQMNSISIASAVNDENNCGSVVEMLHVDLS